MTTDIERLARALMECYEQDRGEVLFCGCCGAKFGYADVTHKTGCPVLIAEKIMGEDKP
ncbi:MAG: hypothetical protein GY799_25270 [Desulfobulbaceae bacterium]|nr:hypothetical protein [Desulfobulbaceae bacterium]